MQTARKMAVVAQLVHLTINGKLHPLMEDSLYPKHNVVINGDV